MAASTSGGACRCLFQYAFGLPNELVATVTGRGLFSTIVGIPSTLDNIHVNRAMEGDGQPARYILRCRPFRSRRDELSLASEGL